MHQVAEQGRRTGRRRALHVASNLLLVATVGFVVAGASAVVGRADEAKATEGVVALAAAPDRPAPQPDANFVAPPIEVGVPSQIRIDTIGVTAPVAPVGLAPDGTLVVPAPGTTGWYELGVRPGEAGYAVIAGHVDSYKGPGVFYRLRELRAGAEIKMRSAEGVELRFVVESVEQQAKTALPASRMWQDAPRPMLALVTCGGAFDRESRSYLDNVVVYAALAETPLETSRDINRTVV